MMPKCMPSHLNYTKNNFKNQTVAGCCTKISDHPQCNLLSEGLKKVFHMIKEWK